MVLYKHINRPYHVFEKNLPRAQDASLVFHQSCIDANILFDNIPASAMDNVVNFVGEVLFKRETPTLTEPGGDSTRQNLLARISCHPEEHYILNRETSKRLSHCHVDEASLEVSKQIDDDHSIKNYSQRNAEKRLLPCITSRFRNSCSAKRKPGTTYMKFQRLKIVFNAKYSFKYQ